MVLCMTSPYSLHMRSYVDMIVWKNIVVLYGKKSAFKKYSHLCAHGRGIWLSWLRYLYLLRWMNVVTRHIRRQTEDVCHQRNEPLNFSLAVRPAVIGCFFDVVWWVWGAVSLNTRWRTVYSHKYARKQLGAWAHKQKKIFRCPKTPHPSFCASAFLLHFCFFFFSCTAIHSLKEKPSAHSQHAVAIFSHAFTLAPFLNLSRPLWREDPTSAVLGARRDETQASSKIKSGKISVSRRQTGGENDLQSSFWLSESAFPLVSRRKKKCRPLENSLSQGVRPCFLKKKKKNQYLHKPWQNTERSHGTPKIQKECARCVLQGMRDNIRA